MTDWRQGPNGVLLAPTRGQPPDCPRDFERVTGANFQCQPTIECKQREIRVIRQGCCDSTTIYYCHRDHSIKMYLTCKVCNGKER